MTPEPAPAGRVWRTPFSTWKVEADQIGEVSFPFGGGFGCGASFKVAQGQKLSLQTQCKIGAQLGAGISATGVTAGVSSEYSETIMHELSANIEWNQSSRPCEYCNPRIHFPAARITIVTKYPLHLPLFVTRKTVFSPGEEYQIHGHCRHAPEICGENCSGTQPAPGAGPISTASGTGGPTYLERVLLADRTLTQDHLKVRLRELLTVPDDVVVAQQVFFVGLLGEYRPVSQDGRYAIYSLDEIDRAIGSVRLYPGDNRLLLVTRSSESQNNVGPTLELADKMANTLEVGSVKGEETYSGVRLVEANLPCHEQLPSDEGLRLRITAAGRTEEWPAIIFKKPSVSPPTTPARDAGGTGPTPDKLSNEKWRPTFEEEGL